MQNDDIIKLLNLEDTAVTIKDVVVIDDKKYVFVEKELVPHYCPDCGFRMHSRGVYERTIKHPIMQDGLKLIIKAKQRTWKCINSNCNKTMTDTFNFVDKYRQSTKLTDLLIVEAFRDFSVTAAEVARRFNVSDTYAIYTFERYVEMSRRPLTRAISIDEVHLNISDQCNYALVIQDFITGEPIDMLVNRRQSITEPYFTQIPREERRKVEFLITDMYKPYVKISDDYFLNAVHVVDAFHVIQLINRELLAYVRDLQSKFKKRDEERHEALEQEMGRRIEFTTSKEYYLLKNHRWVLLKNHDDINFSKEMRYDRKFKRYMSPSDYEREFFSINTTLSKIHSLKEKYIQFNREYAGKPNQARVALRVLIQMYASSEFIMFQQIAETLNNFFEPIINSFIMIERIKKDGTKIESRLSNGPIESLNRIPKDMKRNARGYRNFEHIRNRFLFSQRKGEPILAIPKEWHEVYLKTDVKRGPYKKKK